MRKEFNKYFIMCGVVCIGICLFMANDAIQADEKYGALSSTLYVGGAGAGNYSKIQYAIDNASNGDTIFVYSGVYYENVVVNKSINLIGEDRNATIIDGNNSGDVVYVTANNVSISNFTIRNSGNLSPDSGIKVYYSGMSSCTISYCNINNSYYGILFYYQGDNNTVYDCNVYSNEHGIYVLYTDDNIMHDCNVYSNSLFGIIVASAKNNTIYNCSSYMNGYGIGLAYAINTSIYNCNISSNDYDNIRFQDSYNNSVFNCNLSNCNNYSYSHGIHLYWQSENNSIYFNTILNNTYGIYSSSNCNNNFMFHNNIINNTIQAYDFGNNTWDNGYPSGGNYWSDYTTPDNKHGYHQNLSGFDLIVDYSYNISGGSNKDRWPHAIENGWMKPSFVPNVILVEFKQNVSNSTINTTIANYGTEIIEYLPYVNVYLLNITAGNQSEFDTLYMFQNDTNVNVSSLDMYVYLRSKPEHLTAPNDQCYPKQWHLNNYGINPGVPTGLIDADIDAPQAWEHLTDCRKDWNNDDFVIAIIDSGVDLNHPDIVANFWINPLDVQGDRANNGIDDDGDGIPDWLEMFDDFDGDPNPGNPDDDGNGVVDDIHGAEFSVRGRWIPATRNWVMTFSHDGSPDDEDGHGTHCAGIICAHGNNGIGVTGVCWRAQLMVLKTGSVQVVGPPGLLNIGLRRASASLFARCVNYIIQQKNNGVNVRVVSYSMGISRDDVMRWYNVNANRAEQIIRNSGLIGIYRNAIQRIDDSEILFVCAVGNNGQHIDRVDGAGAYSDYPPKLTLPNIITVDASDNQDRLASFSNYGTTSVDIVAPGENILSLAMHGRYVYRDNDGDNKVSPGDTRLSRNPNQQLWQRFRYSEITAIYPAGSTVVAGDGDSRRILPDGSWWGYRLINFNANEKYWDLNGNNQYDPGECIYRDNDNSNTVTSGDTRLTYVYINNELKYFHNSNVNAGDADVGKNLHAFAANEKHRDNGNGRYDAGEYIYRDVDNNNWVSAGDIRLTNVESSFRGNTNVQAGNSDVGDCLHGFAGNEKHTEDVNANGLYDLNEDIYIDNDNSNTVSAGDQRLRHWRYPPGSFVQAGDSDIGLNLINFQPNEKYSLVTYMSGTSMATPMVAGSVAHFWCQFPNLNHLQVKDWILRKVDPRASLKNTVVSGIYNDGRLRMISGFDFGDAPDPYLGIPGFYPTVLWHELSHGASHEDIGEEWLGWDVSPEYDANVITTPPYDVDIISNLLPSRTPPTPHPPYQQSPIPDLDAYDDGVTLPLVVFPGGIYDITFHIQTENPFVNDVDHGRYDEFQVNKRDQKKIYINTYFDWNHDGDWDDGGEHLVKCPAKQCTWWGGPGMICCYGIFWPQWFGIGANFLNENAWRRTKFTVPWNALPGETWVRTRLDYGENAGRAPSPRYDSHHPFISVGEVLQDTYAHAQLGEVEDYWIYIVNKIKLIGEPKYEDTVLLDILQEDFTYGVPPMGWTDTSTAWMQSETNYSGGTSPEAMLPWYYAEDGCMFLTYPINTTGSNELTLRFNTFVDDYGGYYYPYTLHLHTSTDGINWQEVWNISPTEDYGPSLEEIVLTSENGVGSPAFYIAFTFTGNYYGIDYWYIDDVVVSGDAPITYVTSLTPFEIVDYPLDCPYPVWNWYRLWYEGTWSDWIEYGDTFYLGGEGMHQVEYYGKAIDNDRIIFYDNFDDDIRWITVDIDNTGYTWQWTNITPYWLNETMEGYFMLLDDSICGEICNLDQLRSAPINCGIFDNTMLYFDGIFKTTGNEKLWVNITNDYWDTWTNVLTLEENASGPWLINISEIADGNEVMVKFTYSDNCSVGYGALIKYVMLYGDVITYAPLHHQFHYVDETPPVAIIDTITPYTQTSIPFEITYNASDDACGLKEVWLYFRYSYDNSTWSDWLPYAKSNNGEWIFHAPYAPAYYEFYSTAIDNLGNSEAYNGTEARAYIPVETFAFELKEGWNLITLPCENNYNASSLYSDINGCSIILSWNASMQDFGLYVPGSPYDFEIENGHGYFIGIKYDTYFALVDNIIEYVNVSLSIGWNILGWFNPMPTNASSIYNAIDNCTIVLKWNASMQDFELYAPGVPDVFIIKRGEGFLVAVTEQSIWHGEG